MPAQLIDELEIAGYAVDIEHEEFDGDEFVGFWTITVRRKDGMPLIVASHEYFDNALQMIEHCTTLPDSNVSL